MTEEDPTVVVVDEVDTVVVADTEAVVVAVMVSRLAADGQGAGADSKQTGPTSPGHTTLDTLTEDLLDVGYISSGGGHLLTGRRRSTIRRPSG